MKVKDASNWDRRTAIATAKVPGYFSQPHRTSRALECMAKCVGLGIKVDLRY